MDKYEYNLKIDQIRQAVEKRENISTAVKIADEIDWKKEKDVSVLIVAADAYELGRQYGKAKEMLLIAYEKSQTGRQLAYRLALLSAKTKEFDEAEEFYQDFVEMAPRDTARYVLRYRISKAKGEPLEKLIEILEEYVDLDMEERWMYELAKLYHLAGESDKCVDLCDEMSLWFSTGEYVRKALDLKKKYKPLTKRQEENYYKTDEEKLSESKENITGESEEKTEKPSEEKEETKEKQATIPFTTRKIDEDKSQPESEGKKPFEEEKSKADDTLPIPGEINIEDIHIRPLEGDGSDTMDLQAEIAKNMKEIMGNSEKMEQIKAENNAAPDRLSMTLDPLFKYDSDGQIGLDIEEPKKEDKQITGQLSIEEVLRNLEERGILKSDTVNKTVETMDQAAEAVDKAAEEAAIKAENDKKNETIVQEIEVKDLVEDGEMAEVQSALESYADDTVNGFVFTEEIDSAAIEEALLDSKEMPMPDISAEEVPLAKTLDISDVEIATPKMKEVDLNTPIEGEKEQAAPEDSATESEEKAVEEEQVKAEVAEEKTTAKEEAAVALDSEDAVLPKEEEAAEEITLEKGTSVLEVLEEETEETENVPVLDLSFEVPVKKIHPGIAPTSEPVAANTASLKELFADLDEATKREIGILEEEQQENETAENGDDAAVLEESGDKAEDVKAPETDMVSEKKKAESISEAESLQEAQDVPKESAEEVPVREESEKTGVSDKESDNTQEVPIKTTEEESETGESADPEAAETAEAEEEVPQVNVTTNTNLNKTMSLNLEKIMVTDEEMVPFDSFKAVNGLEQKIKDTVITLASTYEAAGHSKTGNVMILGDDKSGKTTMAIELIKLINKKRERTGRRIAKVDASVLNSRGIRSSMKKLIGSDLIVENAQHLRKTVLTEFVAVGQYYTDNMLIVFEGETSALKTMRKENEEIARMFDHVLVIKEYDVKEWVAYAKKFASTKNYMIDEMGTLALYKSIDDFYGKHQGIDQSDVETIVSHAIKKANAKVARKFTNLFSGKNDDTGMDILKEADFK